MKNKTQDHLTFDSLKLEGGLFVPDLLEKAAQEKAEHQRAQDYQVPKGLKLHDEYGRAFLIAQAQWKSFTAQQAREDIDPWQVTETFVQEFLRDVLGYHSLQHCETLDIQGRSYPIAYQADAVPVVIAPYTLALESADARFAVGGTRKKSPIQLLQEYLNASPEGTWGLVCNGLQLRLMRHASSLTRPAYLQVDLQAIFSDKSYANFSALWRLLHASRAQRPARQMALSSVWESWRQAGIEQGTRVREDLSKGVTEALKVLGNGFLQHPENQALREALHTKALNKTEYFNQLLRLVYRCLFLYVIEERELLHPPLTEDSSKAEHQARAFYAQGYSLKRLRAKALEYKLADHYSDLWQAQKIVFRSLAQGEYKLALPALGGLFAPEQCASLDACALSNRSWLEAQFYLRWSLASGQLAPIDYRNMGPEELGSVYESLLELVPEISLQARSFGFVGLNDEGTKGNARKLSGSYYTPDSLVQELLKSALEPVIAERIAAQPEDPSSALLSISVLDPACGSGHFLLAAARRLAEQLALLRSPEGAVQENHYRHALREVISHCIYGIDRNPMALELARTALWIEGFEPGRPLSFLDHHLVCGDALLGITQLEQMEQGIPDKAFKPLSGDDKSLCAELKKLNRQARKDLDKRRKNRGDLLSSPKQQDLLEQRRQLEALPDDTLDEIAAKQAAWQSFWDQSQDTPLAQAADLFVGAFLIPKTESTKSEIATTLELSTALLGDAPEESFEQLASTARKQCNEAKVLHWPLAFPKVFAEGGFDCILGNPPWERIKLQEEEFFASRHPVIAAARNKAERGQRIEWLGQGQLVQQLHPQDYVSDSIAQDEKQLYAEFISARRLAEATSIFAHLNGDEGGRYPLTGVGDVNTYALFSETIAQNTRLSGRSGFIVPTGIATDDSTKAFFAALTQERRLVSLFDFENRAKLFQDVDSRYRFSLITLGHSEATTFAFYLTQAEQLQDSERRFTLSAEDFALINPNTLTCPVFRSNKDAELTKKIYRNAPVLIREAQENEPEVNPWGISFMRMLDMSNDSHLFQFEPAEHTVPLYEAKMIHQFDHRWATYDHQDGKAKSRDVSETEKADPNFEVTPRYWVSEREVMARVAQAPKSLLNAWVSEDEHQQRHALANWVAVSQSQGLTGSLFQAQAAWQEWTVFKGLLPDWADEKQQKEAVEYILSEAELAALARSQSLTDSVTDVIQKRSPRWLMGWRDITNATNERTVIASVIPFLGVGHTLPLFYTVFSGSHDALLLANFDSLTLDYIARQKVGGTHLTYGYLKQFPFIAPEFYSDKDKKFILPRVLELIYTSYSLKDWAKELGYTGEPYTFDPVRRAILRAELDAYYARLYGLTRDELRYILDPADVMGEEYPSETFRVLKKKEIKEFGEYRTQRLVLEAWDKLSA